MQSYLNLPGASKVGPEYHHRLGKSRLRFGVVLRKVTKAVDQWGAENVGQVLAVHSAHSLGIVAVLCLVIEHVKVAPTGGLSGAR